jgi:hypothetical protein
LPGFRFVIGNCHQLLLVGNYWLPTLSAALLAGGAAFDFWACGTLRFLNTGGMLGDEGLVAKRIDEDRWAGR